MKQKSELEYGNLVKVYEKLGELTDGGVGAVCGKFPS